MREGQRLLHRIAEIPLVPATACRVLDGSGRVGSGRDGSGRVETGRVSWSRDMAWARARRMASNERSYQNAMAMGGGPQQASETT